MATLLLNRWLCPSCLKLFRKNISYRRLFTKGNSKTILENKKSVSLKLFPTQSKTLISSTIFATKAQMTAPELSGLIFNNRYCSSKPNMQKHVSAIVAKRPIKKKTPRLKTEKDEHLLITAYAVAEELNLSQLRKSLDAQGLYTVHELPIDVTDGLYVKAKYAVDEEVREIFFFTEGSVVFWNMPEVERREVLKYIRKHCDSPHDMSLVLHEMEYMPYKLTPEKTDLVGEVIQIQQKEDNECSQILEKYAFSNALAQAVNLGVWEASLEKFADLIEPVTQELRDGKSVRMSRRVVLRRTGELFSLRHVINLSSDLLDTPDFYWERQNLEPLYQKACNNLNITRRTRVMNERLSYLCELMDLLSTHLNDAHHTRLEWMIIILILVEVVFEIIHYIERYLSSEQMYIEEPVYEQEQSPPAS